ITFATLLLAPFPAMATETEVTIPSPLGDIIGTLNTPDGVPAPVVLLFHGFTGARDELPVATTEEGVFSRTARMLAEQGYASLRIDFRGSGESPGEFADTTFEGQIADGMAAMEWLAANPAVRGDDLAIIGWSQGGLVASAVAGRSGTPDAVALWAAVADPAESLGGILGAEVMTAGAATGDTPLKITLPWGAEIALKQGYFDGIMAMDPVAEIAAYQGSLFVAHGRLDTTVLPAAAEKFITAHEGPEELWMAEMDHVFNAFTGPETLDQMVAATIGYLDAHMGE
ncbi:MAG: alpha/beta hydrolase family protein, partial [Paracoccaceae bacterium]